MDIISYIERRRNSFKNPCFNIEPLMDWVNWACRNGTLHTVSTKKGEFEGVAIAWKVPSVDYSGSELSTFIDSYQPKIENYDLFVLDFTSESTSSRNSLIRAIILRNPDFKNVWAFRKGNLSKISYKYINHLYNI